MYVHAPLLQYESAFYMCPFFFEALQILGKGALVGGLPKYTYVANRFLPAVHHLILPPQLSEYHTGYRAFSKQVLEEVSYNLNSDDFIFDNQMLCQIFNKGFEIAEITCPTKYFEEASSINLERSIIYGFGVMKTVMEYFMSKHLNIKYKIFDP